MTMKAQAPRLYYDSFEDAAREVVNVCGGPKVVGALLWPAKTADAARTRLLDCLNTDRIEKLAPEEIFLLARMGRERGCHAMAAYFNADTGYAPPIPVEPEDERAELQRAYIEMGREMKRIAERIERTEGRRR